MGTEGRWPTLYHLGVGLNFGFAIALLAMLVVSRRRLYATLRARPEHLLYLSVLALLFLLLPSDIAEVVNLGERFLYLLAILLILETSTSRWMPALAALSVLGFAITLIQLPAASLKGADAAEAFHRPPEVNEGMSAGRAYSGDGLFSHRLYQNDERRTELRNSALPYAPLLFDTGVLKNR